MIGPNEGDIAAVRRSYETLCQWAAHYWNERRNGADKDNAIMATVGEFTLNDADQSRLETWLRRSTAQRRKLAARN